MGKEKDENDMAIKSRKLIGVILAFVGVFAGTIIMSINLTYAGLFYAMTGLGVFLVLWKSQE